MPFPVAELLSTKKVRHCQTLDQCFVLALAFGRSGFIRAAHVAQYLSDAMLVERTITVLEQVKARLGISPHMMSYVVRSASPCLLIADNKC